MKYKTISLLFSLLSAAGAFAGHVDWDVFEYPIVESFKWREPFPEDGSPLFGFDVPCEAKATFHGKQYKFSEFETELAPYSSALHSFFGQRDYPGTWGGVDHGGQDRQFIMMEYNDVPLPVKHWVEEHSKYGADVLKLALFSVLEKPKEGETVDVTGTTSVIEGQEPDKMVKVPAKEKVMVFAPGALYQILPLWVAAGSECERESTEPGIASACSSVS